jgi:hypothetical protein
MSGEASEKNWDMISKDCGDVVCSSSDDWIRRRFDGLLDLGEGRINDPETDTSDRDLAARFVLDGMDGGMSVAFCRLR